LSLARPERVRFRYRLEGFEPQWVEAGTRRQAFFTNLDPGSYRFRVIAANEHGVWNESGAALDILIPPKFVQTRIFVILCALTAVIVLWFAYLMRVRHITARERSRLGERIDERERIARELHDTLLQGIHGLILKFQAATDQIPTDLPARGAMEAALDRADQVLIEGRDRVKDLRSASELADDLPRAIAKAGEQLLQDQTIHFGVIVEGTARPLHPIVNEETLRIACEALANASQHAKASRIEVEVIYERRELRLRFRDDGIGIDNEILSAGGRDGHWGLAGMRERAKKIRGQLEIWSRAGAGTEIELHVPGAMAYAGKRREKP
jgi:signal transduction histidine kinase